MNTQLNQHFLIDKEIINKLVLASNLQSTDIVVEIGPGTGNITKEVLPHVNKVIGIELDRDLEAELKLLQKDYHNLDIIYANALDMYIPKCNKIISNLPFSIIEPFINKLIKCDFEMAILITGDNYIDGVINNDLNNLSILTNAFFKVEKVCDILPDSFDPKPRTKAGIIILKHKSLEDLKGNFELCMLRELYFHRDMKIKNALIEGLITYHNLLNKTLTKRESKININKLNISEEILNKKIDELSNDDIKTIYDALANLYDVCKIE
jgi:16S rRNA (adenine1518-N6/adenine1519-N6)-dimethyltransferase